MGFVKSGANILHKKCASFLNKELFTHTICLALRPLEAPTDNIKPKL